MGGPIIKPEIFCGGPLLAGALGYCLAHLALKPALDRHQTMLHACV